jgi:hypothetical protein
MSLSYCNSLRRQRFHRWASSKVHIGGMGSEIP